MKNLIKSIDAFNGTGNALLKTQAAIKQLLIKRKNMEKLDEFILKHRKDMYEYIATLLYTLHDEIEVDESEIDIRLAIDLENNQWQVMYGDASYDQKHYPLCAASSFNCNTKPKHLLETLLNDF